MFVVVVLFVFDGSFWCCEGWIGVLVTCYGVFSCYILYYTCGIERRGVKVVGLEW